MEAMDEQLPDIEGACVTPQSRDRFERQAALVERLCEELQSPEPGRRAAAVRQLCPCRTKWVVPVKHLVVEMSADPNPEVQRAANHVLYGDSNWGNSREDRRHKVTWRSQRPRARGWRRRQLGAPRY
jgi:hypothetical protein